MPRMKNEERMDKELFSSSTFSLALFSMSRPGLDVSYMPMMMITTIEIEFEFFCVLDKIYLFILSFHSILLLSLTVFNPLLNDHLMMQDF